MAKSTNTQPPPGLLTGGNATDIYLGPPRKIPAAAARDLMGTSSWPLPFEDDSLPRSSQPPASYEQGFARLMARLDQIEANLADTNRRLPPLDFQQSVDLQEPRDDVELFQRPRNRHQPELPPVFSHARGGGGRGCRGGFPGAFRRPPARDDDFEDMRAHRPPSTFTAQWDRGHTCAWEDNDRERTFRQPTAWDSPLQRARAQPARVEAPNSIKMDAPKFDGSDTSNWISRVQYYFDHFDIPEHDRLHYVVMLFQPPASE